MACPATIRSGPARGSPWLTALAALILSAASGAAPAAAAGPEPLQRLRAGPPLPGLIEDGTMGREQDGVLFLATPYTGPTRLGPAPARPEPALQALVAAYDALNTRSPVSRDGIARLTAAGRLVILYTPNVFGEPKREVPEARFAVNLFRRAGNDALAGAGRVFALIVGEQSIQWATSELGPLMADRLVGFGGQVLSGVAGKWETNDSRCEAGLYREQAAQDLEQPMFTRMAVAQRRMLEQSYCARFKEYLATNAPDGLAAWSGDQVDVPKLLTLFERFIAAGPAAKTPVPACDAPDVRVRVRRKTIAVARGNGLDMTEATLQDAAETGATTDERECAGTVSAPRADAVLRYRIFWSDPQRKEFRVELQIERFRVRRRSR